MALALTRSRALARGAAVRTVADEARTALAAERARAEAASAAAAARANEAEDSSGQLALTTLTHLKKFSQHRK